MPGTEQGPAGAHPLPGGRQDVWRERAGRVESAKKAFVLPLLPLLVLVFICENNSKQTIACCSFSLPSVHPGPSLLELLDALLPSPPPPATFRGRSSTFYNHRPPPYLALPGASELADFASHCLACWVRSSFDLGRLGLLLGSDRV